MGQTVYGGITHPHFLTSGLPLLFWWCLCPKVFDWGVSTWLPVYSPFHIFLFNATSNTHCAALSIIMSRGGTWRGMVRLAHIRTKQPLNVEAWGEKRHEPVHVTEQEEAKNMTELYYRDANAGSKHEQLEVALRCHFDDYTYMSFEHTCTRNPRAYLGRHPPSKKKRLFLL